MKEKEVSIPSSTTSSTESVMKSEEGKVVEREGWKGTMDFILTCIGYAVGLGNIWRFPYLCYKSGGGAFFIPYVIFLCLCGIPLFFMETVYGQFSSLSPIAIWNISPMFKGVGIGMVIVSGLVCVYYNVIVAWTLYYLFMSFRAVLPWSTCGNWWNTDHCLDVERSVVMAGRNASHDSNSTSLISNLTAGANYTLLGNATWLTGNTSGLIRKEDLISSSEEFWENHVLQLTDGIETLGGLRWQLVITLALAWICVFFCLFKGVAVLGKVMHFCAPFPYLVLLVLLIRGVTLDGAIDGIKFYIIPRWEKLATFQVWGDAALQIFYSVGMAWGGIITMASYNDFKHNVYRDAMLVPFINCGTSIFAGFVIFSILGFMAHETGKSVEDVVTQGPGLTFVAYPEAVSMLPISPLWSVLFFLMLFIIGLDSQFGMFETCLSAFMDEFPKTLRKRRVLVSAIACFIEFLLGLPLITEGGIYVLQIIDWYCASFSLMLISFTECVAIGWVYGVDRFYRDIELMIGYQPNGMWKVAWKYVTPLVILFVWLFSIITLGPVTYGGKAYPEWAVTFGWCLGSVSIIPIPACAIYQLLKADGTFMERLRKITTPSKKWGPRKDEHRQEYLESLEADKVLQTLPMYQTRTVKRNVAEPEAKSFLS
ncbi:sodium- and chloride-dependent GABA transporter 1-like isoform X2 [Ruditapes philippinarum]|uniref:sodium- and chloride-dependent GABA transporter 1-like isoform X2 n=1 Tax=Ruditapes philippinarum TaxID=129788 RepID=UPI00295AF377|nr:sodium- and chloride-dependent GABA transporter 1-like isoform X2 [Ruditapes philippinarum]